MMNCIKLNETKQTIAVSTRKGGSAVLGNRLGAVDHVKDSLFQFDFHENDT